MSNATIIAAAFGEDANLYEILGIENSADATAAQLRKAYYRKSLQCHPDKVQGKQAEFQALTVAYNILKNDETRKEYDESGELVDEDDIAANANSFDAMKHYFSSIFGQVTTSKIDQFAEKYKCSEEEESDVLKYYRQFKGNVAKMLQNVMLSTERDAERWVEDYLTPAIDSGEVPDYRKTLQKTLQTCLKKMKQEVDDEMQTVGEVDEDATDSDATESDHSDDGDKPAAKTRKKPPVKKKPPAKRAKPAAKTKVPPKTRMTKAQREAQEAEALMAKIQNKHRSSSALTIGQQGYNKVLNGLASKYGGAVVDDDDPLDDEAFAKIQAGITSTKKAAKKSKRAR